MRLAPYIRTLGRGPSRSRSLTQDEAREAMQVILSGRAEPEAIGALLMLLRLRGESVEEVAGFVEAVRASLSGWERLRAAVDWPSYAAGQTRGHPYFLLAAKLVVRAGFPVLLHGWNSHQQGIASVRNALPDLEIPLCRSRDEAQGALARQGIAYVPLEDLNPTLHDLLRLRDALGLRSIMNTVVRMMNPAQAEASLQGVFHPSYRTLQTDVGALVGQRAQAVIKGGGGEFERHPAKTVTVSRVRDAQTLNDVAEPLIEETRRLHESAAPMPSAAALWSGEKTDPFAEVVVTGTAVLALSTLCPALSAAEAQDWANALWSERNMQSAVA